MLSGDGGVVPQMLCFGGGGCADIGLLVSKHLLAPLVFWLRCASSSPKSEPCLSHVPRVVCIFRGWVATMGDFPAIRSPARLQSLLFPECLPNERYVDLVLETA